MFIPAPRTDLHLAVAFALSLVAAPVGADSHSATVEDARAFLQQADRELLELSHAAARASWVYSTYITDDTLAISAEAQKRLTARTMELAGEATRFDGLELPPGLARQLKLLKLSLATPAPRDPQLQTELAGLAAELEGMYGKAKYCAPGKDCLDITALTRLLASSRDSAELADAWTGWRGIAPPMKPKYRRFVELANQGARDLGFADLGALWRSNYDMPPDEFARELDRLWLQVKPLFDALHAYVRGRLVETYGADEVPADGPIPAHLLGNMWAQEWGNVYPLVTPPRGGPGYDVTQLLKAKRLDAREMVRYGERFFTSLGFEKLPESFWSRSLFTKPADRDVVCHASAWDVDNVDDLRIKMCIDVSAEDFVTIHHELGHNFYQRAYNGQPYVFRNSANDGFHEAIGDAVALSVTPDYLVRVGLLEKPPAPGGEIGLLLRDALDKVAFLPFGLLVDQWRWKVFSGEVPPERYNEAWWELRRTYQGVAPPVARSEGDFDPGAKYHVPANVPYTRYFLARILQFQFHRALCREAGFEGPLYQCSIYGSEKAGTKLEQMLAMGQSRPWPEALEALTGERELDATALFEYFEPLKKWLDEQNAGRKVGY